MHMYIYDAYTHTYMYRFVCLSVYTHTYLCTYLHIHACLPAYIWMSIHTYIHAYADHVCLDTYTYGNIITLA